MSDRPLRRSLVRLGARAPGRARAHRQDVWPHLAIDRRSGAVAWKGAPLARLSPFGDVVPAGAPFLAIVGSGPSVATQPLLSGRIRLDDETSSVDQLRASRGVITLGSSYYAGHGRTLQADSPAGVAALLARPDALGFDPQARDDLMTCLLNDCFVRIEDLRAGRFGLPELLDRHARLAALGAPAPPGIMGVMTAATGQPAR